MGVVASAVVGRVPEIGRAVGRVRDRGHDVVAVAPQAGAPVREAEVRGAVVIENTVRPDHAHGAGYRAYLRDPLLDDEQGHGPGRIPIGIARLQPLATRAVEFDG